MTSLASLSVREAYAQAKERLAKAGILEAGREAEELACKALGQNRSGLWARMDEPLETRAEEELESFLRRREAREPLQLVLEEWDFLGLKLKMRRGVFIPRPETESLALWCIDKISRQPFDRLRVPSPDPKIGIEGRAAGSRQNITKSEVESRSAARVLELGVGSGALLGSILALGPSGTQGFGVDRSWEACSLAALNLRGLGVADRARLFQGSWVEALSPGSHFDLLVSNPPYLDSGLEGKLMPEVGWDPPHALYSPDEGLADIRGLLELSSGAVVPGGWLGMETGPILAEKALSLLEGVWSEAELIHEAGGRPIGLGARRT